MNLKKKKFEKNQETENDPQVLLFYNKFDQQKLL